MSDRLRVAVLGATGLVGQRLVYLLHDHPWFDLEVLAASREKTGLKYSEAVHWLWDSGPPDDIGEVRLSEPSVESLEGLDLVFSALPSGVARELEVEAAKAGLAVISNASPMRLDPDVPLINPEVNPEHLALISEQRRRRKWKGFIVKDPNCTTVILTLSLKPLLDRFGIKRVRVATMQALSGAGYRGVLSMDIVDNVIPFIKGEEEKVRDESRKILGRLGNGSIEELSAGFSASCHRVPVIEGHLESVFVELKETPNDLDDVVKAFEEFVGEPQRLMLPTAPRRPIIVRKETDRPQPRLDRYSGGGMSITVGRVRWDEAGPAGIKYLALGSNTIRGAAGTAVLIGELLKAKGYL